MRIIDTHMHLWDERYQVDEKHIIKDFLADNPENIMLAVGTHFEDNLALSTLSHKNVFIAMGVHPEYAQEDNSKVLELIENNKSKIVAIGEIGLDFYYNKESKEEQIALLKKQLDLAVKIDKPIIFHCREACGTMMQILADYPTLKGVIHCFSCSLEIAQQLIKRGFYIGIGGSYTFKGSKNLKEIIATLGLSNVLLETDSPYLAPTPYRGQVNRPQYVRIIAQEIANQLNINIDDVLTITNQNAINLFNLHKKEAI